MASWQITHVRFGSSYHHQDEKIVRVKGVTQTGETWEDSVQGVIQYIDKHPGDTIWVMVNNTKTTVHIVKSSRYFRYLRTSPDETKANNLENLPQF